MTWEETICLLIGRTFLWVVGGLAFLLTVSWLIEMLLSAIYRKMRCSEAFLAFLLDRERTKRERRKSKQASE